MGRRHVPKPPYLSTKLTDYISYVHITEDLVGCRTSTLDIGAIHFQQFHVWQLTSGITETFSLESSLEAMRRSDTFVGHRDFWLFLIYNAWVVESITSNNLYVEVWVKRFTYYFCQLVVSLQKIVKIVVCWLKNVATCSLILWYT